GIGELHALLEGQAGEGLTHVELLTVAVKIPVIVGGESGRLGQLATEQSARERQPHEQGHATLLGLGEQRVNRLLPENVEDDLEGRDAVLPHAERSLFHRFDADAEIANLALPLQLAEMREYLTLFEFFERDTVQL